jgi:hypothetical protein
LLARILPLICLDQRSEQTATLSRILRKFLSG